MFVNFHLNISYEFIILNFSVILFEISTLFLNRNIFSLPIVAPSPCIAFFPFFTNSISILLMMFSTPSFITFPSQLSFFLIFFSLLSCFSLLYSPPLPSASLLLSSYSLFFPLPSSYSLLSSTKIHVLMFLFFSFFPL